MNVTPERRASPRFPAHFPVIYYYLPHTAPRTYTINLSAGGTQVEALDHLPLGASVAFLIVLEAEQVLNTIATVIHVEPRADTRYSIGVRFGEMLFDGHHVLTHSLRLLSR